MLIGRIALLAVALAAACDGPYEWKVSSEPSRPIERAPAVEPRAADGDAVEYTLRFGDRATHYVDVEAVVPTGGADAVELSMAVWTPGSYLVREYARHVERVSATSLTGEALAVDKTSKNRWRVQAKAADRVVVRYRVYGHERSVRTNFVAAELAVINGAPTFLRPVDDVRRPYDVALELPDDWAHSVTSLRPHPGGQPHRYLAADYDELVDSPIVCGNPTLREFEIEGVPHRLATFGGAGVWDDDKAAADLERLVRTQAEMWGVIPYDRYVFLNVLIGGGGLEHMSSTLMMGNRWATRTRKDYVRWLGLASHEFFHTWNVKRLRPAALGPFDYEREVYTESLWVAEGITSYYDDLLLRRAGLIDRKEYLDKLSGQIEELQTTPGRREHALSDTSFDAWIKYYRRDENFDNTSISYYTKGAVVAFLLDARVRAATGGARSLDDVMRLAYERYSGERGYTPAQFRAVAEEVAGESLQAFFARAVDGTEELDYGPALDYFGLAFDRDEDKDDDEDEPGWLGVDVRGSTVSRVLRGTPAFAAGVNVGDEVLAIDELRVHDLGDRLRRYRPGDEIELLVARRGRLRRLPVTLGSEPQKRWKLKPAPGASAAQQRHRRVWLEGF